jgi:hypothetical protein
MAFERPMRIRTAPIEAIFPYTLNNKHYPYPTDQDFQSLAIEAVTVHFNDGTRLVEILLPRYLRYFGKDPHKPSIKHYEGGIRLPNRSLALLLRLSYDVDTAVLDGYVDYSKDPYAAHIDYVELEYSVAFRFPKD